MKKIQKIWLLSLIVVLLMSGSFAFARDVREVRFQERYQDDPFQDSVVAPSDTGGGDLDAEGVISIFERLAQFAIFLGMALIVIYIVISGIKIATAGGDVTRVQDAKKSLYWGLIGAVVILGVYVIINTIKAFVVGDI